MNENVIDKTMESYVKNDEMLGGALIVRKKDQVVYKNTWGYSDFEKTKKTKFDNVYRMCSMTKPVIAVGIMMLEEQGKLSVDDPVRKYIPAYSDMKVVKKEAYTKCQEALLKQSQDALELEAVKREITICDLMSHSCGIGQGMIGMLLMNEASGINGTLEERVNAIAAAPLDFNPGEGTGYSPLAAFDILSRIIEIITGLSVEEFCQKEIFDPLDMKNTGFRMNENIRGKLVTLCERKDEKLVKVTDKEGLAECTAREGYVSGSAGLFSSAEDYEKFAKMLVNDGKYCGKQMLKEETVKRMQVIVPVEAEPITGLEGMKWALGVIVRTNPEICGKYITKGTYGWSGSFGTHFFVSPEDELECVFVTNRSDLNGAFSYISKKVEELVFQTFTEKKN